MTWRSAVRVIGLLLSVACLAYFAINAAQALASAGTHLEPRSILAGLASALLPYAIGYAGFAVVWYLLLTGVGVPARATTAFGIFFVSQFGKYLPGNVAHHAGRLLLSKRFGYETPLVGAAMGLEMLVVVTAAVALSIPLATSVGARLGTFAAPGITGLVVMALALIAVGGLCIVAFRHRAIRLLLARLKPLVRLLHPAQSIRWLGGSLLLALLAIALCAGSLGILGSGSLLEFQSSYLSVVALFSVAWIAGLLTPGAPAGLGIREVILMEGLSVHYGQADATAATILFRLLTVAADLIALGVGAILLRTGGGAAGTRADIDRL